MLLETALKAQKMFHCWAMRKWEMENAKLEPDMLKFMVSALIPEPTRATQLKHLFIEWLAFIALVPVIYVHKWTRVNP